jgi:hypothetical protein
MSFTSATFLRRESLTVAELYRQLGDWHAMRYLAALRREILWALDEGRGVKV